MVVQQGAVKTLDDAVALRGGGLSKTSAPSLYRSVLSERHFD